MTHTSDCAKDAFQLLCEMTDTPYALKASLLLASSDKVFVEQLQMPKPSHYRNANDFRADYLVYNYLRKYVKLDSGVDKKAVALSKWYAAEEQCANTNTLLNSGSYLSYEVESAILRARLKIAAVLGTFSFDKVLHGCGMGPGATFDVKRRSPPGTKLQLPISVTGTCLGYAKAWLEQDIHWAFEGSGMFPDGSYSLLPHNFNVVRGNKLTTVPKDSSTDRVICIEPTFNLFLQKGVGKHIRRRLQRSGIDLDDQTRNQQLAHMAYAEGYATIDLSSASDTICSSLVKLLLPLDWWIFMDHIRCAETRVEKQWRRNAKWSSMGNGFTFELETLIFWALAPAESSTASVYGDDIICDQKDAPEYIKILEGLGFTINTAKSYIEGSFFESCGRHFFQGLDVTPKFQKEEISNALSFVRASNRLFKHAHEHGYGPKSPASVVSSWLKERYPYSIKPTVPHTADDRGFLTYHDPSWIYDPNRGFKCRILKVPGIAIRTYQIGLYITKLQDPFSQSWLTNYGQRTIAGMESKARLKSAWIQPFALTNEWLPLSNFDREATSLGV